MWQAKHVTQVWFAAPYGNQLALIGYLLVFPGSEVTLSDLEWDIKARITRQEIDLVSESSDSAASDAIERPSQKSDQAAVLEMIDLTSAISDPADVAPAMDADTEQPKLPVLEMQAKSIVDYLDLGMQSCLSKHESCS